MRPRLEEFKFEFLLQLLHLFQHPLERYSAIKKISNSLIDFDKPLMAFIYLLYSFCFQRELTRRLHGSAIVAVERISREVPGRQISTVRRENAAHGVSRSRETVTKKKERVWERKRERETVRRSGEAEPSSRSFSLSIRQKLCIH